jgi:hypothetical protein
MVVGIIPASATGTRLFPLRMRAERFIAPTRREGFDGGRLGGRSPTWNWFGSPPTGRKQEKFWFEAFANLAGATVGEVVAFSDYIELKNKVCHYAHTGAGLIDSLLLPAASDVSNVGIQLRSTAELGAAFRLISHSTKCRFVLMDTTLALPMVSRRDLSLFYEHLKRLCCVTAREAGVVFLTISKSHSLPCIDTVEQLAAEVCGTGKKAGEHWYLASSSSWSR